MRILERIVNFLTCYDQAVNTAEAMAHAAHHSSRALSFAQVLQLIQAGQWQEFIDQSATITSYVLRLRDKHMSGAELVQLLAAFDAQPLFKNNLTLLDLSNEHYAVGREPSGAQNAFVTCTINNLPRLQTLILNNVHMVKLSIQHLPSLSTLTYNGNMQHLRVEAINVPDAIITQVQRFNETRDSITSYNANGTAHLAPSLDPDSPILRVYRARRQQALADAALIPSTGELVLQTLPVDNVLSIPAENSATPNTSI